MEDNQQKKEAPKVQVPNTGPNEQASFVVDGFVKIFDPNTKEVYLEKRA